MPIPPPLSADAPRWYYMFQGQQQGPLDLSGLLQLISTGRVQFNDMVWRDGLAQWAPAGNMPELSQSFARMNYATPGAYQPGPELGQNAGIRMLLPVGRSGWAIAAGYLGLFSFLVLPAPIALIISVIAIWDIRRDKTKHGMGRAIFGLVMGLLGTGLILFWLVAVVLMHK